MWGNVALQTTIALGIITGYISNAPATSLSAITLRTLGKSILITRTLNIIYTYR